MKIKLCKHDQLYDWYSIVRAEHENKNWLEITGPNSSKYCTSERLIPNDACIEGTKDEMLAIAYAIKNLSFVSFKRCAVRYNGTTGFYFYSPRNSEKEAFVSYEDSLEFADKVLEDLGG